MEIEQMRIRMGEMAAEIERLHSVIDEANAQEPVGYSLIFFGGESPNMMTCFASEFKANEYAAACARPDNFVPRPNPAPTVCPLYARPIPAQQSYDQALQLLAESRENFEKQFGFSSDADWVYKDLAELFISDLPGQKSPAVAVPDLAAMGVSQGGRMPCPTESELFEMIGDTQSPRITEQDAREIAKSAGSFAGISENAMGHFLGAWASGKCGALLEKLNKPDSVGG